jgi:hypothetical protein
MGWRLEYRITLNTGWGYQDLERSDYRGIVIGFELEYRAMFCFVRAIVAIGTAHENHNFTAWGCRGHFVKMFIYSLVVIFAISTEIV